MAILVTSVLILLLTVIAAISSFSVFPEQTLPWLVVAILFGVALFAYRIGRDVTLPLVFAGCVGLAYALWAGSLHPIGMETAYAIYSVAILLPLVARALKVPLRRRIVTLN